MTTYGDFPGIKVETIASGVDTSEHLTFEEQVETMVCIKFALGDGYIDTDAVQSSLECLGYSPYRTMPMFQETLKALGEELD